jgi:CRP-like cAMP-binding protein
VLSWLAKHFKADEHDPLMSCFRRRCERGNFLGEVAFLTDRPASATVIAEDAVRALAFERGKLSQLFHDEAEVAGIIYQLLGRELAYKIKVSNTLLSTGATSLSY